MNHRFFQRSLPIVRPLLAIMIPFGILLVLLGLSTSISTTQAAQSFGATTDGANILPQGDEPLLSFDQEPNDEGTTDPELIVVRAYFDDRQMVYELAGWNEPWEVRYDEGYLVIGVTAAEYDRLLAAGFRLEIDEELTAEMNQVREPNEEGSGIPGYVCYRTVEETLDSISQMVSTYPTLATSVDIGNSWEKSQGLGGYDLMVVKLTNSEIPGPKPKLFAMSSVHAREYAPAELNTRFAEYLLQNYGTDADATWILDHHEIHLLLQANPDGRKQAETGLLWRKNKNNNFCANTNSRGIDLNRNYSFSWNYCNNNSCSSSNQCDLTYRGASASSEPETQAVEAYVRAEFPDQREEPIDAAPPLTATGIFFDIHSFSQLVLWPWGFNAPPPNEAQLQTLGRKLAYFNDYYPVQAVGLYPTDGTTDDFAYGELGLAAYTFEVGTSFFQACSTFENTILPDNLPALLYAAKVVRTPYMTPAGPEALGLTLSEDRVGIGQEVTLEATLNDSRFNSQNGTEPTQAIAAAEYYIDVPPWVTTTVPVAFAMSAADGSFNSTAEGVTASIDSTGLSVGKHTIFVRGQDSDGNWGAFSAIFLDIGVDVTLSGIDFTPDSLTIALGESVTWGNEQGFHNVVADDGTFTSGAPAGAPWTYSETFNTAGSYQYYCQIHGAPGGQGMSGVIIVGEGPTATPIPTNTPIPATNTPTSTPFSATNTPTPSVIATATQPPTALTQTNISVKGNSRLPTLAFLLLGSVLLVVFRMRRR
jgi:plastocyanin